MKNDLSWSNDLKQKIIKGLELSSVKLLEEKRIKGQKLVVMLDGKIKHLTVDEYVALKKQDKG